MAAGWEAPGPGLWELDPAHQLAPPTRYWLEIFPGAFNAGLGEAFRAYGLLLDRFDMRLVNGWAYFRARPVGATEASAGLPPRFVFRLLFRVHPELRRRRRSAARAVASRAWRREAEQWRQGLRDDLALRNAEFQRVEPTELDGPRLREHIVGLTEFAQEAMRHHFRHAMAQWIAVGSWLGRVEEWTGVPPAEALGALRGSSPASVRPVPLLDRVARAVERAPQGHEALARRDVEALREASPEIASALDDYLEEYGQQLVTGFDLADRTVSELPQTIAASIAARLERRPNGTAAESRVASLRGRVPGPEQAEFDELLDEARALYALREDDVGLTYQRPLGLLRRALLAAAARLVEAGEVAEHENILDATPAEVVALLGGPGPAPAPEELAARTDERREAARRRPPLHLGPDEATPPLDWLPSDLAHVNGAAMLALSLEGSRVSDESPAPQLLRGGAASPGRYQGRARIVLSPADFGRLERGDVLVTQATTPTFVVLLPLIGAVVTDHGGVLSHAAIVAREFGIPAVVGTGDATSRIPDGARIVVDGDRGVVTLHP